MSEQHVSQLLVVAGEELEQQRQQLRGRQLAAVAHEDKGLNQRAPQRGVEHACVKPFKVLQLSISRAKVDTCVVELCD